MPAIGSTTTTNGTTFTGLINTGPIVGLTASNSDYDNEIFSIFTDFGTPAAGGIPARPGFSGVQGSADGELLIGQGVTQPATLPGTGTTDTLGAVSTQFRRFESIAFDQFGYFSQSMALTAATSTHDRRDDHDHVHGAQCAARLRRELVRQRSCVRLVRDGDAAGPVADEPDPGARSRHGSHRRDHRRIRERDSDHHGRQYDRRSNDFGGRIIRVLPDGTLNDVRRMASRPTVRRTRRASSTRCSRISFSADGTTLYASDDQGIWQFKTTADLAELDERHPGRPERPSHAGRALRWPEQRGRRRRHRRRRRIAAVPGPGRAGHQPVHRRPGQPGPCGVDDDDSHQRRRRPAAAVPAAAAAAAATSWPTRSAATEHRSRA